MGLLYSIYYGGYLKFFKLQLRRLLQLLPLVWPILNFPLVHWQSEPISRIRKDIQCCLINLVDKHDIAGESLLQGEFDVHHIFQGQLFLDLCRYQCRRGKQVGLCSEASPSRGDCSCLTDG